MNKYQKGVLVVVAFALVIAYFTTPLMLEVGGVFYESDTGFRPLSYMVSKIIIVLMIGTIFFSFLGVRVGE